MSIDPPSGANVSAMPGDDNELQDVRQVQEYLECLRRRVRASALQADAWERFYGTYRPLIEAFARASYRPGHDVDDCIQEIWEAVLARLPRFRCDPRFGQLRPWMWTIARHAVVDRARRLRRRREERLDRGVEELLPGRDPDPASWHDDRLREEMIRTAMLELREVTSECSYQILSLRWFDGLSMEEIGRRLGLTAAQVRFRHFRVVAKLRTLIRDRFGVDPMLSGANELRKAIEPLF